MDDADYRHLLEMRKIYQRRLQTLERQAALLGTHAEPHILLEVEDLKAKIAETDHQLSAHPQPLSKPSSAMNEKASTPKRTIADDIPLLEYLGPLFQVLFRIGNLLNLLLGQAGSQIQPGEYSIASLSDLEQTLYKIAHDMVLNMNLVGAKIESVDHDNLTLYSRAYFINPDFLGIGVELSDQERMEECERQVKSIERTISHIVGKNLSLKGPDAKLSLGDERADENMGLRAFHSSENSEILIETDLLSAFLPGIPEKARPAMRNLQKRLGIKEIAALPLTTAIASARPRFTGTLLVAASRHFTESDKAEIKKYGSRASQAIFSDHVIASLQAGQEAERHLSPGLALGQQAVQNLQESINSLIAQHWHNYHNMELQKAKYEEAPVELLRSIEAEKKAIEQLKVHLRKASS